MAAASSNKETFGAAEVRVVDIADSAVAEIEFVWQILAIKGIYLHTYLITTDLLGAWV